MIAFEKSKNQVNGSQSCRNSGPWEVHTIPGLYLMVHKLMIFAGSYLFRHEPGEVVVALHLVPQLALLDVKLSEVGKGVEGTSNGKHKTSAK